MAVTHGRLTNVYMNGYDFTGVLNKATFPMKQDIHPVPVFGKTARPKIPGLDSAMPKVEGWLDNPSGLPTILDSALGSQNTWLTYLPDGDAFGNFGWACLGTQASLDTASSDAPNKIVAGFESNVGAERIASIVPLAAITGATNGSSVNNVVATTVKCVGHLQVHAMSGFTALAVKLQHSVDNSAWVDLANFTSVTAARTCERIEVAAGTTVNKYVRAVMTPTGSGSVTVHVGFGRYPA